MNTLITLFTILMFFVYRKSILHNASNIIGVAVVCKSSVEVGLFPGLDVLPDNFDIPIPIVTRLFVSLTEDVQHLMHCDVNLNKTKKTNMFCFFLPIFSLKQHY